MDSASTGTIAAQVKTIYLDFVAYPKCMLQNFGANHLEPLGEVKPTLTFYVASIAPHTCLIMSFT